MEQFFSPKKTAVIGASNSPFNLGATICNALNNYLSYDGEVYAVNRKGESVHGSKGFTSVLDLPDKVDCAIVITSSKLAPEMVRQCGQKGITHVIIESAGFSEEGEEGKMRQEEIHEAIDHYGLRVIGPNCLGVLNTNNGFSSFFGFDDMIMEEIKETFVEPGTASYIIQSGGVGVLILESLPNDLVGLNKMVSIGNKSDIDESDCINYFNTDQTEVIGLYLENIPNGKKFMDTAKKSTRPILAYKVGKTEAGSKAAMSHTAGMANNDRVFESACRQSGIIRLNSISELHSMPKIFTEMPLLKGDRIAMVTNSGAFGGITADIIGESGLTMAHLSECTQEKLSRTGMVFNAANPVDIGPALPQTYLDIFEILLSSDEVDGIIPLTSIWRAFIIDVLKEVTKMCHHYGKPAAMYTPNSVKKIQAVRSEHRLTMFDTPEEAVRALDISYEYYTAQERIRRNEYENNTGKGKISRTEDPVRI